MDTSVNILFYLLLTLHVSTPVLGRHQAHDEYKL
jgi:hypothetical protein